MKPILTIETIADMAEGQAGVIVNAAIRAAIADCEDRGDDEKARKVVITLEFLKMGESIGATVEAIPKVPAYRTKPTIGEIVMDGPRKSMRFSADSRRHDQPAIPGTGRTTPKDGE